MLNQRRAYTLIELLIVIAIIGLMAVLAVPAFASYTRKVAVAQKADDVVALMKRAYTLSKNPDNGGLSYQITVETGTNSVFLKSSNGGSLEQVDKVTADSDQIFNCPNSSGCPVMNFPTDVDSGWSVTISGSVYTGSELFQLSGADQYDINISTGASNGVPYKITAEKM